MFRCFHLCWMTQITSLHAYPHLFLCVRKFTFLLCMCELDYSAVARMQVNKALSGEPGF